MIWPVLNKRTWMTWLTDMTDTSKLSKQLLLFKLAIVFLTRWPVKITQTIDDKLLNSATGYFALVGVIVAGITSAVYYGLSLYLSSEVAIVLAMIASLLFTGAFHEDGLADTADGFGGGWLVEQKLNIMKDSRLGTYGASALFLALLAKFQLLTALSDISTELMIYSLFMAHGISRAGAVSLIGTLEYVQLDAQSKTKPVAQSVSSESKSVLGLTVLTLFILIWLSGVLSLSQLVYLSVLLFVIRWLFMRFVVKQLGGYTGDVLGAAQQVFELSSYVLVLALVGGGNG